MWSSSSLRLRTEEIFQPWTINQLGTGNEDTHWSAQAGYIWINHRPMKDHRYPSNDRRNTVRRSPILDPGRNMLFPANSLESGSPRASEWSIDDED